MLLAANLVMFAGVAGFLVSGVVFPFSTIDCSCESRLCEWSLRAVVVGMVLSVIVTLVEASGRLIELTGWFV